MKRKPSKAMCQNYRYIKLHIAYRWRRVQEWLEATDQQSMNALSNVALGAPCT